MEYPSKRQKLSRILGRSYVQDYSGTIKEPREARPDHDDATHLRKVEAAQAGGRSSGVNNSTASAASVPLQPPFIHAAQSTKTVVASALQVVIDNGSSTTTELTIPDVRTVLPFPTDGPVIIPVNSNVPTVTYPTVLIPTSLSAPSWSLASGPAATDSMSIFIPGSSSQVVLSSPPPTPVPSHPAVSSFSSSSIAGQPVAGAGNLTSLTLASGSTLVIGGIPSKSTQSTSTTPDLATSAHIPFRPSIQTNSSLPTSSLSPFLTSSGSMSFSTTSFSISTIPSTSIMPATSLVTTEISSASTTETSSATTETSSATITAPSSVTTETSSTAKTTETLSTTATPSSTTMFNPSTTLSVSSTQLSGVASSSGGPGVGAGGAGSPTNAGAAASSTASTGSGSGNSPSTPVVVGGVVGGVAGLTLLIALLLLFLNWRRRKMKSQQSITAGDNEMRPPGTAQSAAMTQRSSGVPLTAAGFFGRLRPYSGQTIATTASETSERGFQNLGGRKIESVLTSGGSGYGDPGPAGAKETLSGSSFYRDSQGFYGGPGSPGSTAGTAGMAGGAAGPSGQGSVPTERDKEVAVMRPGPARTPVTLQSGFVVPGEPRVAPTPSNTPPPPPRPRDGVGRSHPSFDGSRGSRFTENVG